MTFRVRPDRVLHPAGAAGSRFVLADIVAPEADQHRARRPLHVALVLDRSGSMAGRKIELARQAARDALARLAPEDRFSVVVYDNVIDVVMPMTAVTAESIRSAGDALSRISARANTNLFGGWLRGCEEIARELTDEAVARCLLLTDGLANEGVTAPDEIVRHVEELRRRGIATTTFGVGQDFNEGLLRRMAEAGGGNFYLIEDARQIGDYLTSEIGELAEAVARGAALVVEGGPGLAGVESLSGFPAERAEGRWRVRLGMLVSRQELSLALELRLAAGPAGETTTVHFTLEDADGALGAAACEIPFSRATPADLALEASDRVVLRAALTRLVDVTRMRGFELNYDGRFEQAAEVFRAAARRLEELAGDDPEIKDHVARLLREAEDVSSDMARMERKLRHSAATYGSTGKDPFGRSKKAT